MQHARSDSFYNHGFVRVCVGVPFSRVADPSYNVQRLIGLATRASQQQAALVLFPELALSSYAIDDLLQQDALLDGVERALHELVTASATLTPLVVVGAPLRLGSGLYNCAVVLYRGSILGVVPKTYLPNYREFYEKRQFSSALSAPERELDLLGQRVPFGNDLIFADRTLPGFAVHAEICEDLWTPLPPSTYAALAGATLLVNLSASNITIGKAAYRRTLCAGQSGRCIAAYLYSAAGPGESTTDLAWDGHALVYENGDLLAETERFASDEVLLTTEIDLDRLRQDRMRSTSFNDTVGEQRATVQRLRLIPFTFLVPDEPLDLLRRVDRFPFVPSQRAERDALCYEAYHIQVHGLMQRLQRTGMQRVVIGVSGGLDSTQALLVAVRTMDRLGLPRRNVLAYTMPGFATSAGTRQNAHALMAALGVSAHEIDITASCLQMLRDIGHPFSNGEPVYDRTFENVQAGERTSHLFRLANLHDGLVLGTGDLSELAVGWATYGVGDQMSHYNVNVSVPKTLIQYLIRWIAQSGEVDASTAQVLTAILATEISPELVPASEQSSKEAGPAQRTEEFIGPYELQDFHLYYLTRFGFRPRKVLYLCEQAWGDIECGAWPEGFPLEKRHAYDRATIAHWLEVFLWRFFKFSQFKRSALPNGPKVGSGGSLSPRGDWRAPSDAEATVWLQDLHDSMT